MSLALRISRAIDRAVDWFFLPVDGRTVLIARIGLGLTLAWAYARYLPDIQQLFGPEGVGGHASLRENPHFVGLGYERVVKFRLLHHLDSAAAITALALAVLVAALSFAIGFMTRLSGLVAVGIHTLFVAHNTFAFSGWAQMLIPFMLYVIAAGPGCAVSVDAIIGRGRGRQPTFRIVPWGLRLLQIHLCVLYLVAGWERLDHQSWVRGEMVLRAAAGAMSGRFDLDWMALKPVLEVGNYAVFLLEPLAPVLLWLPRIGRWWAVLLIAMHAGIEIFTETGWWQPLMISCLVVFLPPHWFSFLEQFGTREEPVTGTTSQVRAG